MDSKNDNPQQQKSSADELVIETATHLRQLVADLASRLRPFPEFLDMVTVQAIELEPLSGAPQDRGCVVVLPEGEICELDLKALPGIGGVRDFDSVEELIELELLPEEYVWYAASAVRLLYQELRRRGK